MIEIGSSGEHLNSETASFFVRIVTRAGHLQDDASINGTTRKALDDHERNILQAVIGKEKGKVWCTVVSGV